MHARDSRAGAEASTRPLHRRVDDDDRSTREALANLLRAEGFVVELAGDGAAALEAVKERTPDAVITDASMPVMGGVELCEHLHALDPDLPVVLMTAFGDMQSVVHAMRAGARDYLTKPLQAEAVVSSVLEAIQLRGLRLAKAAPRASRPPEVPAPRTVDSPSSVVAVADTDDHVARRDQLARIARELRAVNERLVISSIREQEHAEEEVRQRAQLAALLGNLSEGVVIADAGGKIRMINEAARR
ncbi:MAG: response regulator, partial [Polyangiales bacterium]